MITKRACFLAFTCGTSGYGIHEFSRWKKLRSNMKIEVEMLDPILQMQQSSILTNDTDMLTMTTIDSLTIREHLFELDQKISELYLRKVFQFFSQLEDPIDQYKTMIEDPYQSKELFEKYPHEMVTLLDQTACHLSRNPKICALIARRALRLSSRIDKHIEGEKKELSLGNCAYIENNESIPYSITVLDVQKEQLQPFFKILTKLGQEINTSYNENDFSLYNKVRHNKLYDQALDMHNQLNTYMDEFAEKCLMDAKNAYSRAKTIKQWSDKLNKSCATQDDIDHLNEIGGRIVAGIICERELKASQNALDSFAILLHRVDVESIESIDIVPML